MSNKGPNIVIILYKDNKWNICSNLTSKFSAQRTLCPVRLVWSAVLERTRAMLLVVIGARRASIS